MRVSNHIGNSDFAGGLRSNDISISKQKEKIEKKKLERAKAKVIDIETEQVIPYPLL